MTVTKGLEGVVAASSSISSIIDGVLTYRGIHIDELAEHATFEEVVYLLWFGKLPTYTELEEFQQKLSAEMKIPAAIVDLLKSYPKDMNTMAALRSAVSSLALFDAEANDMSPEANVRKAIRLQAQLPVIVAAIARVRENQPLVEPKSDSIDCI